MIDIKGILNKDFYSFDDLVEIMKILRDKDNGCPWDIVQTHESIRNNFIEEVYEAIEGIDTKNDDLLKEELGDVLLQVVFHAEIATSEGKFDIDDVSDGICKKLILRHPHIFKDVSVSGTEEVLDNWDAIKKVEKSQETLTEVVESIAKTLPSLMRCEKIIKKTRKAGLEKSDFQAVKKDAKNIIDSFADGECVNSENIGQLLSLVVSMAMEGNVNSEEALFGECEKRIDKVRQSE